MTNKEVKKRKWGYIPDYKTREEIKWFVRSKGENTEEQKALWDLYIFVYWSRSLEASRFDEEHPDFYEYKEHYQVGDVNWLKKGYSYVNMDLYKKQNRRLKNAKFKSNI